jgi:hypothetical protein
VDLVPQIERESQAVEAGTQIGAGRRRAHNKRVWQVGFSGA